MPEEYDRKKRKQVSQMKSVMDYGMGIFILLIGLFFLFRDKLENFPLSKGLGKPDATEKVFGGLCILYSIWRIYRGYKKNYFK